MRRRSHARTTATVGELLDREAPALRAFVRARTPVEGEEQATAARLSAAHPVR